MALVHRDEPLRRGAEDHRVLAAPAVWIAMIIVLTEEQYAAFAHELNDLIVCVEHTLAREVFDVRREAAGVIDWAINIEAVAFADDEVVVTMARRGVYQACTCLARRLLV